MTGWRIGYAAGPEALIKAMAKVMSQTTSNPSLHLAMGGGRGAERHAGVHQAERQKLFEGRRDLVVSMLNQADGTRVPDPGRRLLRLSVDCAGADGQDRAQRQGHRERRGLRRRAAGDGGRGRWCSARPSASSPFFRISYATSNEVLEDACTRIQRFAATVK